MKLNINKYNLNIPGPPPPIFYNPNPTISKTSAYKSYLPKANIKTQPRESDSNTAAIYVLLFWTGSPEALLEFVMLLNKIIRGHDLSTGPQKFGMTRNLVIR